MLISDIKALAFNDDLSDEVKIRSIKALFNEQNLSQVRQQTYADISIDDEKIHDLDKLLPKDLIIDRIEILSIQRVIRIRDMQRLVDFSFSGPNTFQQLGEGPSKFYLIAQYGADYVQFKIICAFRRKVIRFVIEDSSPVTICGEVFKPVPIIKLRLHLKDKE